MISFSLISVTLISVTLISVALIGLGVRPALAVRADLDRPFALLQGLDKITARVSPLEVVVGEWTEFGTLDILVQACRTTPPEETPEDAAFLEIINNPPGEAPTAVFTGWMFSSSPAVSALDHPVFDVWLVDCVEEPPRPPEDMGVDERRDLFELDLRPPRPPEGRAPAVP